MSDIQSPAIATPRFALPYLFAGQTQKEAFVNEALARIDLLVNPALVEQRAEPPASVVTGSAYLVATGATGHWSGRAGNLASWTGDQWLFVEPVAGMTVRDLGTSKTLVYDGEWTCPDAPDAPAGGTTIDGECRTALADLIQALQNYGIFSDG